MRSWTSPASLIWLIAHIGLVFVGILSMTETAHRVLGSELAQSLGTGILATGVTGLVLYLYVRSTERLQSSLEVISQAGIRSTFPDARIVLIEADARTRFERHIRRARPEDVSTFFDFLRMDDDQMSFGAVRVGAEVADLIIRNDGDFPSYFRKVEELPRSASPRRRRRARGGSCSARGARGCRR